MDFKLRQSESALENFVSGSDGGEEAIETQPGVVFEVVVSRRGMFRRQHDQEGNADAELRRLRGSSGPASAVEIVQQSRL